MIGKHIDIPDVVGKVTCYRGWHFGRQQLYPFKFRNVLWNHNPQVAVCLRERNHRAPVKDCSCGLYGFYQQSSLNQSSIHMNCNVIGITEHWGKAEVHQEGIRSQYAQIKALTAFPTPKISLYSNKTTLFITSLLIFLFCLLVDNVFVSFMLAGIVIVTAISTLLLNKWYWLRNYNQTKKELQTFCYNHNIIFIDEVKDLEEYASNQLKLTLHEELKRPKVLL